MPHAVGATDSVVCDTIDEHASHRYPGFSQPRSYFNSFLDGADTELDDFLPPAKASPLSYPTPDFSLTPITLGPWIKDDLVRKIVDPAHGFRVTIDDSRKGHIPSKLNLDDPDERAYVLALERDGIIKRGRASWNHSHFWVRKPGKLRLVFHGKRLGRACPKPPWFKVHSYKTNARSARESTHAALFDFAHFYFNIHLSADIQTFFGMRTSIGDFVWLRAPFGWSWSAFLAHSLAEQVIKHLRAYPSRPINISHYMDDCPVFGMSEAAVNSDLDFAMHVAESELGVKISHPKTIRATQVIKIIGVVYDLERNTSSMASSYFSSVARALLRMENGGVTRVNVAEIVGALVFPNQAYPGSLSLLYDLLLYAGSLGEDWNRKLSATEASSFLNLARYSINQFSLLPPCALQATSSKPTLIYADATPTQLGAIDSDGRWYSELIELTGIYRAEAAGMDLSIEISRHNHIITLVTDNSALYWAAKKGWSPDRSVNRILSKLFERRLLGDVIFVKWVKSEDNPADLPSRVILEDGVYATCRLFYENYSFPSLQRKSH